jgi:DNA-binding transcriptional ArsR family regulator
MRKSTADALFSGTRRAILAATLLQPERWWYLSDLARHLGATPSSLQRELASLATAGILMRREEGRQVYYRANPECPILAELQGIMVKTVGLADALKDALVPLAGSIDCAFVFGSFARGEADPESDVDVMVIGEVGLAALAPALQAVGERIGRTVNPAVYRASELAKKLAAGHHFLTTVMGQKKLFLIGDEDKLAKAVGRRRGAKASHKPPRTRRSARSRRA